MLNWYPLLVVALLLGVVEPEPLLGAPQEYVVMGTPLVNLRTGPSTNAMVIGRAEKGDIYRVLGQSEDWYEILMFSGESRFVTKADYVYPLETRQLADGHRMALPPSGHRAPDKLPCAPCATAEKLDVDNRSRREKRSLR